MPTLDLQCFCTYPGVEKKFQAKKRFKEGNGHFGQEHLRWRRLESSLARKLSCRHFLWVFADNVEREGKTFREHSPLLLKKDTEKCMWALRKQRSQWAQRLRNVKSSLHWKIKKHQQITKTNEPAEPALGPSHYPFHSQCACQIKGTLKMIENGGTFPWILGNRDDSCCLEKNRVSDHNQGQPLLRILVINGQSYKLKMVPLT